MANVIVPLFTMSTGALLGIFALGIFAALVLWVMAVIADKLTEYHICEECGDEVSEFEATSHSDPKSENKIWYCPECSIENDS